MTDWLIYPLGPIEGTFAWRYSTEAKASVAAHDLSIKNNIDVVVAEIVGTHKRQTKWCDARPTERVTPDELPHIPEGNP